MLAYVLLFLFSLLILRFVCQMFWLTFSMFYYYVNYNVDLSIENTLVFFWIMNTNLHAKHLEIWFSLQLFSGHLLGRCGLLAIETTVSVPSIGLVTCVWRTLECIEKWQTNIAAYKAVWAAQKKSIFPIQLYLCAWDLFECIETVSNVYKIHNLVYFFL